MATFRSTGSAVLGTITASADSISKLVSTATVGVDMLANWAEREKALQAEKNKYAIRIGEREVLSNARQQLADIEINAAKYQARSEAHAAAYAKACAEIDSWFNE